ncbi:MAG: membrane dipeptidase [Candidatus Acidiferrum sp.]
MRATTKKRSSTRKAIVHEPFGPVNRPRGDEIPAPLRKLAAKTIGIDSHIDTVQRVLVMSEDLDKRWNAGHMDLPRLREGGTHAPFPRALSSCEGRGRSHPMKVAGIDQIGVGSDFDGISGPPNGLDHVSKMPVLIC